MACVAETCSIAFSGGHREPAGNYFLRKNRRVALVNYFVDNPGHDRVKCAEGTYSRRPSWRGRQCRESHGGGSWWRSCQMSALTAAGEGGWADGSQPRRYRPRTRPAERRLLPGAGRARADADRGPRRGRGASRRQRRRQDHHAAGDFRAAEAGRRRGPPVRPGPRGRLRDRAGAARPRARPARPRDLLRPDGGRAFPAGRPDRPGRAGRRVRPLPGAPRAARAQGRALSGGEQQMLALARALSRRRGC